jgi:hypothetical protein
MWFFPEILKVFIFFAPKFHAKSWNCGRKHTKVAGLSCGLCHLVSKVGYGQHRWLALGIHDIRVLP